MSRFRPEERPIYDPAFWKKRLDDAIANDRLHYAVFATDHETWAAIGERHRELLEEHIRPYDSILDAGCSWGRMLDLFPEDWQGSYLGIDISPDFIAKAQVDHPDREFAVMDLRSLPEVQDQSRLFDWGLVVSVRFVIAGHSGQDVWNAIEASLLKRCRRILYLEYDINDPGEVIG